MAEPITPTEGLRERKKRLTRQQISNTATAMFIEHGFDAVRVADVADACGVSEKTVFNYFPTKEALLLDREEAMVAAIKAALGPDAPPGSPIDAAVGVLLSDVDELYEDRSGHLTEVDLTMIHRFGELIEGTPSLRAAQRDMMDRIAHVAATAMAERAGMDPDDPEPRIAADAIIGLWSVQFRAMRRYADGTRTVEQIRDAVNADVRRAARLIDTGLWSFAMAVQGSTGREQLRLAGEAANDARKQVVTALEQARDAWRTLAQEHDDTHGTVKGGGRSGARERHAAARDHQQAQREMQQAKREAAEAKREAANAVHRAAQAAREAGAATRRR